MPRCIVFLGQPDSSFFLGLISRQFGSQRIVDGVSSFCGQDLTVAVDTFDLRSVLDKEARLEAEVRREANWPALIFVSSPDRANRLASNLVEKGVRVGRGEEFARWIEANFGGGWLLSDAVGSGVGLHHGRIPRAVASHFIRLFNSGDLPLLICTSTLIEGVNTAAKSVLIYDKAINREDFDFFTFSNIRGRAGRLGVLSRRKRLPISQPT